MPNPFIRKLESFANLPVDVVDRLKAATNAPKSFDAKTDLIREGDRTGPVFIVLEGWACRYKILPNGSRQIIAFLIPGDACDLHTELVEVMDHSIQTITPCKIAVISREDMRGLLEKSPQFAKAMYIAQLVDEGTMRAWIVSMGRRTSIERVAHLVCELYLRFRQIGRADDSALALPLSQIILADALGMTPVHINRILKELRLAGAMDLQRGSLIIADPLKLVRIAGFDENYLHRRLLAEGKDRWEFGGPADL